MLEYIEKTSGIYDLLALCCSYILKEDKNTPIEYNMYGEEKYEEIYVRFPDVSVGTGIVWTAHL